MENERALDFEQFVIDDDQKAEWAIKKIADERSEAERLIDVCKQQIDFYNEKIMQYNQQADEKSTYFISLLNDYFERVPHRKTKTQEVYTLPSGSLRLKAKAPKLKYEDAELVKYLDISAPDLIKKLPIWGEFKKRLVVSDGCVIDTESGEIVECITAEEQPPEFFVEVK